MSSPELQGINLLGWFRSEKGLGQATRNIYRSLSRYQIPCSLVNCEETTSKNSESMDVSFSKTGPYKINLVNFNLDFTAYHSEKAYHSGLKSLQSADRYNIGYWNWELENFPDGWASAYYDEIWAPSTFAQKSIQAKVLIPVFCIPYSVHISKPSEHLNRDHFGLNKQDLIFLNIFDWHSCVARKNPESAIEAFMQAFGNQSDIKLVIKMMHGESHKKEAAVLKALAKNHSNIIFFKEIFSQEELFGLINACDVFVSLHRSEGFGFNLCEAMAMGKPVIATNYSANVDYMDDSNGYLVKYQKVALGRDEGPYQKGEMWAEPDIQHAASLMKHIYENREEAREKGIRAKQTISTHYSDEAIGKKIQERLGAIHENTATRKDLFDWNQINLLEYTIRTHRRLIGRGLVLLKKIGRWLVGPALEKQTRVNLLQFAHLRALCKKIECLEEEIRDLKNNAFSNSGCKEG